MINWNKETGIFNKLHRSLGVTALVIVMSSGSAIATENVSKQDVNDALMVSEIKVKIMANDVTRSININVDSDNGMVTLRGTAPTDEAKQKAAEIALSVDGTTSVVNELMVGDSSSNPQTLTAKAKKAGEDTGEKFSDGWITTQVKSRLLADDEVKGMDINVSTRNGEVILAGLVPSREMHDKVVLITHRVEGVRGVNTQALQTEEE